MRVFVIGGTGVIGRSTIPALVLRGHQVTALVRSHDGAEFIHGLGAASVRGDILSVAIIDQIRCTAPEIVINLATSIPRSVKIEPVEWLANDRIRTVGMGNVIIACRSSGVRLLIQESVGYICSPLGSEWITEQSPRSMHSFLSATVSMEDAVRASEIPSALLRFAAILAPDAWHTHEMMTALRRGRLPVVGKGDAYFSSIHAADAASAIAAIVEDPDRAAGATYNIVDSAPAPIGEVMDFAAGLLGGPKPARVPAMMARIAVGALTLEVLAASYRMSAALFRTSFGWTPIYPTYRETWHAIVAADTRRTA